MKSVKVGLIGFGTIGAGVIRILQQNGTCVSDRLGASVEIVKIADLDITTDRGIKVDKKLLTTDADAVLTDPNIDIVVELIGGYEPARTFISLALPLRFFPPCSQRLGSPVSRWPQVFGSWDLPLPLRSRWALRSGRPGAHAASRSPLR